MSRLSRFAGMAIAVTATAALTSCVPAGHGDSAEKPDSPAVPELGWADADSRAVDLPKAPFLQGELPTLDPGEPVLVNFWASTCGPCREEMPLLQELADDGIAVVGVTRDRFEKYALRAIQRAGVTYPNRQDTDAAYMQEFEGLVPLALIPSSVVVVDGRVTRVHIGPFHASEELDEVRALAGSPA